MSERKSDKDPYAMRGKKRRKDRIPICPRHMFSTSLQSVGNHGLFTESQTNMQIHLFMNSSPCVVLTATAEHIHIL